MKEQTANRTKNSMRNIFWSSLDKLSLYMLPFFARTIFIYTLGEEYLGLGSLFSSVLSLLNLAELGFSGAIVFCMYRPIATGDTEKICALLSYFRVIYFRVGVFVGVVGTMIAPFIPKLIKNGYPADINIYILYFLYLASTVLGYFFYAYVSSLLFAHQRSDVTSRIGILSRFTVFFLQVLALVMFRNYYAYAVCTIVNVVITNMLGRVATRRLYPEYECRGTVDNETVQAIKKNVKGILIGNICLTSRNSFDSIFLSMFLGLRAVTLYGNYYYILSAVSSMMVVITSSISAGIGDSVASETVEKNYKDMNVFIFMYMWVAGWFATCLALLYQPFMRIWMGEERLLPDYDVILFVIYFLFMTISDIKSLYKTGAGLFWESRYYTIAEAITNIVLNYILGKLFGLPGIVIATIISVFFIDFIWGSLVVFKYYFKKQSPMRYFMKSLCYLMVILAGIMTAYAISNFLMVSNRYLLLLLKVLIATIVPNLVYYFIYKRLAIYRDAASFISPRLKMHIHRG